MKKLLLLVIMLALVPGTAMAAPAAFSSPDYIEGYLLSLNNPGPEAGPNATPILQMESYAGEVYSFPLAAHASLSVDGIPVPVTAFRAGMEIYARLQGASIVSLEGYASANPGYISPGSKVRTGVVTSIEPEQLEIQLPSSEKAVFAFYPGTLVTRGGKAASIDSLYEGDRVKLFFDSLDGGLISRIQVEGPSVEIKGVYKGTIKIVDTTNDTISLDNVKVLQNGTWVNTSLPVKVPFEPSNIYVGGRPLNAANLKYYRGKTLYAASRMIFGQERLDKMVVLSQYETKYQERINNINWYSEALEMSNNKNLSFNDGTIIVKSGRLVDKYALNEDADILAVADGRGGNSMADVVYVLNEGINNSSIGEHYLYAGRLDQIVEDKVELTDFYRLEQNKWAAVKGEKELYYDLDSAIVNLTSGETLSPEELVSGNYAVDEDSAYVEDNHLSDWFAYIYTDGDRIVAMGVQPKTDSLLSQRITSGTIAQLQQDNQIGWYMSIQNACDWSQHRSRWMLKNSSIRLSLDKALIYKNGALVDPGVLAPGDRVFLVRDDFTVKFVLIK
jgi:hypothetical protein